MAFGLLSLETSVVVIFVSIISYAVFKPDPTTESICKDEIHRQGSIILLSDGRKLGFQEYGPKTGQPVVHFHPMPSSRLFTHPDIDSITRVNNIRLIIVDHPGVGISSPFSYSDVKSYVTSDIDQLIKQLRLDSFFVSGHSSGGAIALAVAHSFPTKVKSVALIAPIILPTSMGAFSSEKWDGWTDGMSATNKFLSVLGMEHSWLMPIIWKFFAGHITDTEALMKDLLSSPADSKMMKEDPRWRSVFHHSIAECFSQGTGAFYHTLTVTIPQYWGFQLSEISSKVHVWRCSGDSFSSLFMVNFISRHIPNSELHLINGTKNYVIIGNEKSNQECGHWSVWGFHVGKILSTLVSG